MAWADNHCHLPNIPEQARNLVEEAESSNVKLLINIGTTVNDSRDAISVASQHENVYATVGVHPHEASGGTDGLRELLDQPKVVAIGETGLDYHYDYSPRGVQRDVFAAQIDLANRQNLAMVVHTRSAWDDTFMVLDQEGIPERTVIHCFTGGPDEASECLARGAVLSFSGIVTFPKAPEVREAATLCPLNRMMVETDSPFLAPVPHRGKPNKPAWVTLVGKKIAEVKDVATSVVEQTTWDTTHQFYGIHPV